MSSRWVGGAAGAACRRCGPGVGRRRVDRGRAGPRRHLGVDCRRGRACRSCRVDRGRAACGRRLDTVRGGCGYGHGCGLGCGCDCPCCDVSCGRDCGSCSCCGRAAGAWSCCPGCGSGRVAPVTAARYQSSADPLALGAPLTLNTHKDHLAVAALERRVREEKYCTRLFVSLDLVDRAAVGDGLNFRGERGPLVAVFS